MRIAKVLFDQADEENGQRAVALWRAAANGGDAGTCECA
jgi:hypothetical protein